MKIRSGFVSNSSSSSFILIGKKINVMDISDKDISEKIYIAIGKELGDGDDIFYVDSVEILWFLKTAHKVNFSLQYFDGFDVFETFAPKHITEDEITFNSKDLPEGEIVATSCWKDYNSSNCVSDLFDKYLYDFDNEAEFDATYNRFQRKDKLKKIEENETN